MDRLDLDDVTRMFTRAERCLVTERREVADELEAFRSFEERVGRTTPVGAATTDVPAGGCTVDASASAGKLDAVRDAYRTTVMSVPHYAETYDDTCERSAVAELGADVGAALARGTAFTARYKAAVRAAARNCQRAREEFLAILDAEHDSLEEAAETLVPVVSQTCEFAEMDLAGEPGNALDAYRARLDVLEERVDTLVAARQRVIDDQRREFRFPGDAPDVPAYLYGDLAATYPVLSTAVDVAAQLDALDRDLERVTERRRCE